MNSVDWEQQWALFAENFHDGKAHINLGNQVLKLKPGPGFGDLSHPTTALMLELMQGRIKDEIIFDIGSGSGILSLAAALLGAKKTYGIDIDPDAIEHSRANAELNGLEKKCLFSMELPRSRAICLMNMIFPEQKGFGPERIKAKLWITSGILIKQKEEYLRQAQIWGWRLQELRTQDQWLGAVFSVS